MSRRIIFSLLLILCSVIIYSQEENNSNKEFEFLSGLTKATESDLEKKEIMLDGESIPIYNIQGTRVKGNEFMKLMISGEYTFDFYMDVNKEIKVAHLKLATDQQKKEMLRLEDGLFQESNLIGKKALPFAATDLKGKKYILEELEGKIIVLNFWFVECKPCVHEISELNNIVSEYENHDVVFIGFATNKESKLLRFLEEKTFDYNIIAESKSIAKDYEVSGYPTHVIIDRESTIVYSTTGLGPTTIKDIRNNLNKLLDE